LTPELEKAILGCREEMDKQEPPVPTVLTERIKCKNCEKSVEFEKDGFYMLKDFGTDPRMNGWLRYQRYEDSSKGIEVPWFCSKECMIKNMETIK
jgi:hypothetical protein